MSGVCLFCFLGFMFLRMERPGYDSVDNRGNEIEGYSDSRWPAEE